MFTSEISFCRVRAQVRLVLCMEMYFAALLQLWKTKQTQCPLVEMKYIDVYLCKEKWWGKKKNEVESLQRNIESYLEQC